MSNTFKSITGIEYTSNDLQTRFYTIDAEGKKTRISRKAYEEAKADHEAKAWEAEAEEEREAREAKIAEDAKATEEAINGIVATLTEKPEKGKKKTKKEKTGKKDQPKAKKTRKSKDIAHEHKDGDLTITLTAKQVDFVLHLSDSCFWERGLDSILWCDVLVDEIGGQFEGKPMTIGAMISTLCEKGLGIRTKDRITDMTTGKSRKSTTFQLTEKGKVRCWWSAVWGPLTLQTLGTPMQPNRLSGPDPPRDRYRPPLLPHTRSWLSVKLLLNLIRDT